MGGVSGTVPAWCLGTVQRSRRSRIVVMHCLGETLEGGYVAIVSQGFPQVVRVTPDVIRPDHSRVIPERWPAICQVRMMMTEAPLVPDLERIESMVAQETSVGA